MSLTTSVQAWLADQGARGRSATVARRHIAAETSTDVDEICATISSEVFFALPVRTRAGHELREGSVLTSPEEVRGYYAGRAGSYVVRESSQLLSLTTDWYVFNETAATLLGTGRVGDVDATGVEWVVSSAVLFPTAPDGIRGEICATRHPMDDVVRGTITTVDGDGARANAALLDELSHLVRAGDHVAAAQRFDPAHTLAVRTDHAGVLTSGDDWPALFAGARDVTLLNRVAGDWFVFAEYLVLLDADEGARRLALLHPVARGRLLGTFGYAMLAT